jgi:IS1 family transposase/transposase-like protein
MCCVYCASEYVVKNGSNGVGKPKLLCRNCGRQFVIDPQNKIISEEQKELIDKLMLEKVPLAGIARVVGVSERWLQTYANSKYEAVPREIKVTAKTSLDLVIECDEVWSFVQNKENKQWVWFALDRSTREIVGVHIGDRSAGSAQSLWDSLPLIYQKHAICYTDFLESYQASFPVGRHHAVGKESGQTNHIERFNCTLRQRVSRLVRKTLSFSKKLENHIGAIWLFVHDYNATLRAQYV